MQTLGMWFLIVVMVIKVIIELFSPSDPHSGQKNAVGDGDLLISST